MTTPLTSANTKVKPKKKKKSDEEETTARVSTGNETKKQQNFCKAVETVLFQGLEDLEGLLINLGVLASLCLSFSIGLFTTIPLEEIEIGEYRNYLFYDKNFRAYAVDTLKEIGFNFTVEMGRHGVIDIEQILRGDYPKNQWVFWETEQKKLNAAFHLTKEDFPAQKVLAYASLEGSGLGDVIGSRSGHTSTMCFTFALTVALTFYLALTISQVKEEYNKEKSNVNPLIHFNKFAMPFIIVSFVALIVGSYYFLWGMIDICAIRSPNWGTLVYNSKGNNVLYVGCLTAIIFSIAAVVVANSHTTKIKNKNMNKCICFISCLCSVFVLVGHIIVYENFRDSAMQ